MTDILIYGDTVRSAELRHEVPLTVPDPFLYAERDGVRSVYVHSLEIARIRELGGIEAHTLEEVGYDEVIASGIHREDMYKPLVTNACRALGITSAVVPPTFPLDLADHLRGEGLELTPQRELFARRRRVKSSVRARGDPPGAARLRGGDGRRARAAPGRRRRTAPVSRSTASR